MFDFYKLTIPQIIIQYNISVHQRLVITFVYTGAARDFIINFCCPRGQKGWTALV